MKPKEQRKIADEIIKLEKIISENSSPEQVSAAKNRIMLLSNHLNPLDMMAIDELIQSKMRLQD